MELNRRSFVGLTESQNRDTPSFAENMAAMILFRLIVALPAGSQLMGEST